MNNRYFWKYAVAATIGGLLPLSTWSETVPPESAPTATAAVASPPVTLANAPSRDVKLSFAQIAPAPGSMALRGANPDGNVQFGTRSDEVVSSAVLNLVYTPSPSLLPVESQLKVYLNDELMGVLPVTKEQLGKK